MADPIPFDGGTRLRCCSILCLAVLAASATVSGKAEATQASEDSGSPWSYSGDLGPEHWGDLDPAYETCVKGQSQSPINLSRTQRVAYTPLAFQYRSQLLEAVNDGHGVRIISPPGSALLIRGDAYDLEEFTFHVPGEHGFDGVTARLKSSWYIVIRKEAMSWSRCRCARASARIPCCHEFLNICRCTVENG